MTTGELTAARNEIYTGEDLVPLLYTLQSQQWEGPQVHNQVVDWIRFVTDPLTGKEYRLIFPDPYAAMIDAQAPLPTFSRLGNRGWESTPLIVMREVVRWNLNYRYALFSNGSKICVYKPR